MVGKGEMSYLEAVRHYTRTTQQIRIGSCWFTRRIEVARVRGASWAHAAGRGVIAGT